MYDIGRAFITAFALIRGLDPELIGIVALSLRVSLSATLIAMAIGAAIAGSLLSCAGKGWRRTISGCCA
jgi:tungstate transport system permease protein